MKTKSLVQLSFIWLVAVGFLFCGTARGAETVSLQGSSNTHKTIIEPAREACEKATGVSLRILGTNAGDGVESLAAGKCDIAMSADKLSEVVAETKGVKDAGALKEFVVGKVGMVVVVHKDNPVSKLTREQLKGLLTGTIESWKELGWKDSPVVVIAAPVGAANRKVVQRDLMGGAEYAPGTIDSETAAKQIEYISVNPEGIMVVGDGIVKTAKSSAIRVVEAPEISLPLTLVTNGEPGGNVKKVIDFFTARKQ